MLSPFISTVHAPQTPCSQPTCVPVSPSVSRRKSDRSRRGSTFAMSHFVPLTVTDMFVVIGSPSRQYRLHGAPRQLPQQMLAIFGRGMKVAVGGDARRHEFRKSIRRPVIDPDRAELSFDLPEPERRIGNAHHCNARVIHPGPAPPNRDSDT